MRNRSIKSRLLIAVVVIMLGAIGAMHNRSTGDVAPEVVINGTELSTGSKVQDVLDAGFRLTKAGGEEFDVAGHEQLTGRTYTVDSYYIEVDDGSGNYKRTNVYFNICNTSPAASDFTECTIYRFVYNTMEEEYPCDVTISGVDFKGMTDKEAVAAFEETGLSYESDDKEEFFAGEKSSLYADTSNYYYILSKDYENENLDYVEVKKDLN